MAIRAPDGANKMKDLELDLLKNAEFKEAFDEFDKVALSHRVVQVKDQDGN